MSERLAGIVKWFSLAKGYGFLRRLDDGSDGDSGGDIFVHYTAVAGEPLVEGERVSFELAESSKGPKALNVQRSTDDAD